MSKALGTVFVALGLAASRDCDHAGDKWLLVDPSMNAIVVANATGMPDLPPGTRSVSYGVKNSRHQGYDRTIVIAGPLSLSPSDEFYAYAKLMRHSLEIFADIVNTPAPSASARLSTARVLCTASVASKSAISGWLSTSSGPAMLPTRLR